MTTTFAFDVYGTLIDPLGISTSLRGFVGDHASEFAQAWRDKQLEYSFRRGLMRQYVDFSTCTREALYFTNKRLRTNLSANACNALMAKYLQLPAYPEAGKALRLLKGMGRRVYAFSNGRPDDLEQLLAHAGLDADLDGVVSVHDVASFKPDPVVYRHFIDSTESAVASTWLVSGNPFDILGAQAVAWKTAWVKRDPAAVFDPWGIEPSLTVTDLRELSTAV
jgi:2-haloacid dehalogenase